MKNFIKKNIVYILVSVIVLLVIICTYFIVEKCTSTNISKLVCTLENEERKDTHLIKYDRSGKLIFDEYSVTLNYESKDEYDRAKQDADSNMFKYKFDDKKLKITHTLLNSDVTDEQWYIQFVKVLETNGYTCK